jgi:hypothetical protein
MRTLVIILYSILTLETKSYNYYELAVQKWCSDEYMIHGLCPQTNHNTYPSYCESVPYLYPSGYLLDNMKKYWKGCDDTLWEHEWEKHGSCVYKFNNISEYEFSNDTITIFKENYDLLENCTNDDCIMGCFDLDYSVIECE